ncbi:hypothetical protein THOG11_270016 [Vibrio harveyi]|nr:hypothetical protein TH15OA1_310017 [Vibrio harveyi]CAH1533792.1 hypothetical protein VHARVF571_350016 [Vibrio harveyi]CAH1562376.1 hypothetical protein THOD03_290016 [Vibrio harveyi]CAH1568610.1 hypothetical protein THOG11_270016 [Vibrio harveyi]
MLAQIWSRNVESVLFLNLLKRFVDLVNSLLIACTINSLNADLSFSAREYIPRLIESGEKSLLQRTRLSEWLGLRTKFTF